MCVRVCVCACVRVCDRASKKMQHNVCLLRSSVRLCVLCVCVRMCVCLRPCVRLHVSVRVSARLSVRPCVCARVRLHQRQDKSQSTFGMLESVERVPSTSVMFGSGPSGTLRTSMVRV